MFANRFTAFIDACTLADTLRRNLLLTLAEAEFFRIRWSTTVMAETQNAIEKILLKKGDPEASEKAWRACQYMADAFQDAEVVDFDDYALMGASLPDPKDAHVLAAALKTRAAMIVTENLKDFPESILGRLNLEAKSADSFVADTIALDAGRAVSAIKQMRERFKKPEVTAEKLLLEMEARGLTETVDVLKPYVESL